MAGADSLQRWKTANPAAWNARLTVPCLKSDGGCGADVGESCMRLDGSGETVGSIHIGRLTAASRTVRGKR